MEITTIAGIIITILIMLYGLKLIFKKPVAAEPSLETELHIDPESQRPVIPRHVRDQLQEGERVEPSLTESKETVIEDAAPVEAANNSQETAAQADAILKDEAPVVVEEAAPAVVSEPEPKKTVPEFTLNTHVEKAEIADFDEESSILDAHLHEQMRVDEESALATAEELLTLYVYPEHRVLSGEKALKVMLKYGLRYGEMQCFHRYNEDGSKLLFSVLQVTSEGGTDGFDLETLSTEEVKGLAFFIALPHGDVQNAFDTMDSVARLISREVGGVVIDHNNQELTPQLREYWRHQAIDYRSGQALGG